MNSQWFWSVYLNEFAVRSLDPYNKRYMGNLYQSRRVWTRSPRTYLTLQAAPNVPPLRRSFLFEGCCPPLKLEHLVHSNTHALQSGQAPVYVLARFSACFKALHGIKLILSSGRWRPLDQPHSPSWLHVPLCGRAYTQKWHTNPEFIPGSHVMMLDCFQI